MSKITFLTTKRYVRDRLVKAFDYATKVPPSALDVALPFRLFKNAVGVNWQLAVGVVSQAMKAEDALVKEAGAKPAMKDFIKACAEMEASLREEVAVMPEKERLDEAGIQERVESMARELREANPEVDEIDRQLTLDVGAVWSESVSMDLHQQSFSSVPCNLASGWYPVLYPMLTGVPLEFVPVGEPPLPQDEAETES